MSKILIRIGWYKKCLDCQERYFCKSRRQLSMCLYCNSTNIVGEYKPFYHRSLKVKNKLKRRIMRQKITNSLRPSIFHHPCRDHNIARDKQCIKGRPK